ncbi:MAG: MtrB/PioB family decaheme-associated outer membrane protein [Xanthomonadales bacterium]
MKRNHKHTMQLAAGACLALALSGPALADDTAAPDTSAWVCKFCVVPEGWFGELDFGLIYLDDWSPKFGDYRGFDDDGLFIGAGGDAAYRSEAGYYLDLAARDLGLDSRQLDVRGGKQGSYELQLSYSEIQRYMGYGTVTPYSGVGSDRLTLPEGWKMSQADPSDFVPLALDTERQTLALGLDFGLGRAWDFDVEYERQDKDGVKAFSGAAFIVNASTFPAPVDYTTDRFTAGVEFTSRMAQVRLEFTGSDFDNGYDSVTWDSPLPIGFGDEVAQSALEPDNKYHLVSLTGAFSITRYLRVSAKVSTGTMEQDDPFLAYSIAPMYADRELPRESLDGKLETSMYNLLGRVYWRVTDRFNITAAWKSNERDNRTPVDRYAPVILEVFPRDPRSNRPYGYERDQSRIDFRFRAMGSLRVNAGFKRDTLARTYQSVEETEEDTIWGDVQFMPWAWLDARLRYEDATRTPSGFVDVDYYERPENPLLRKFNLAERDRQRLTAELDLMPLDALAVTISYYTTDDEYAQSVLGLQTSEERSFNLDANYALSEETTVYAFYADETIDARMAGAESANAMPWIARTEDAFETWGVGISGRITDRLTYGVDYMSSDSKGDILTDSGAGEAAFPVLTTELRYTRAYVDFEVNDRWSLGLDVYNEKYDTADWFVDGFGPTDISGLLNLGETSPDYSVNVIRVLARFRL